jgi:hypothetical protein
MDVTSLSDAHRAVEGSGKLASAGDDSAPPFQITPLDCAFFWENRQTLARRISGFQVSRLATAVPDDTVGSSSLAMRRHAGAANEKQLK